MEEEEETTVKKYQSKHLDEEEDEEEKSSEKGNADDDEEDEDKEKKSSVASSTDKYKVYIDAPDGVEAYLDGSYVGVTPVSFNKVPGSYVVTLRKSGYQPRSYTLRD